MKKEIMVIKDCKFVALANALEIQWSKRLVDENDKILDKENVRGTIDLDDAQIEGSDASERLKQFIPELVLAQAKEIGVLNDRINSISKECAVKVKLAKDENKEKLAIREENIKLINTVKAHEENFNIAKSINDEIYSENQKLKSGNETILKEVVKLNETILALNEEIKKLKETKKAK